MVGGVRMKWFSEAGRDVALRAIELTGAPMECCGKAAAFVQRQRLAVKGRNEVIGGMRTSCLARRGVMLPFGQLG